MPELGEFEIIARYFTRPSADRDVVIGIGDDAAVLDVGGLLAVTVDTLTAGVHFPESLAPDAIGHRALAVNLSDIAAMGAVPRWCTLALTLPAPEPHWLEAFASGFFALAERHGVALVGGNLSRGPLSISVQALGTAVADRFLTRAGARPGDDLYVTGTLGDAAAGLAIALRGGAPEGSARRLVRRFAYPTPRIEAGQALTSLASAAIDVSDGLAADIGHVLERSGCAAVVDVERLPLSDELRSECEAATAIEHALGGGDDYELCFAAAPDAADAVAAALTAAATRVTRIGRLAEGRGLELRRDGRPFSAAGGYRHF